MKKVIIVIFEVLLFSAIIFTLVYNLIVNESFLSSNITQVLTLLLTLGVLFIAVQYKTDQRKMKEKAEDIIRKIQILVTETSFFKIDPKADQDDTVKRISTTNRKINNCISILSEYGKNIGCSEDIDYIKSQFSTYRDRIGEHIYDLDYLSKSENEFKRISENIDTKCDTIILSLYK